MFREEGLILHLAYFDDSHSDTQSNVCVFGGVVVHGDSFQRVESYSQIVIEHTRVDPESFTEFKAAELYYAKGAFQGCDLARCRDGFFVLVDMLGKNKWPFIYSAVDKRALASEPLFGSTKPVALAFEMCLDRLELWARTQHEQADGTITVRSEDVCVVIADECDGQLKKDMLTAFRRKRKRGRPRFKPGDDPTKSLFHIHDNMYFGQSADSVGLQLADVTAWALHRLITGNELDERIVKELKHSALCAKVEPQWSRHRELFKDHADVSS